VTVDPFAGVKRTDTCTAAGDRRQGMLAANLAAFIALKRANPRLNRDVISGDGG